MAKPYKGLVASVTAKDVLAFCADVSPGQTPCIVTNNPHPAAQQDLCHKNVEMCMESYPGTSQKYGWLIWYYPDAFIEAIFHSILVMPNGEQLDVTPHRDGERRICFLPDATQTFDSKKAIPARFKPLTTDTRIFVAHAGDSRCYLYSSGKLQLLTQDHTMTAEMARSGVLPADMVAGHKWRNVVTNFLGGTERGVQVELDSLDLHPDDVLLLCSDGLTEMVPEERIAAVLQQENDPQRACERLIAEANRLGGKDNITAIVASDQSNMKAV